ncbi:hypothetical protein PybrP1_008895 [[Pythium] brassicae (nom. inval.)]|nr:hypothetical protein PybrP1_008895 [[Pythium] brassicae (nom. inval.)]
MVVDRELRRLLECALLPEPTASAGSLRDATRPQRVPAREILAKLRAVSGQPDVNLAELLVLAAEAAIYQRDFGTAQHAVDCFLHDCHAKNQFYCRAQLVRALCASHAAAGSTGASRLRQVLDALHFVLLVLPIACDAHRRPYYDFLVYNASVTYWQIARQLMKRATWQFLAPSLAKVLDALRAVGERDGLWVARLQLALVSALLDAKQLAEAAKAVNELVDVHLTPLMSNRGDPTASSGSGEELKTLFDAALRAQVHVGSMKDAECQKIIPTVKKSPLVATSKRASLLVKLQCVKSGSIATTPDVAYSEIFQEATGFSAFSAAATSDDALARFLDTIDAKSVEAVDADVVVEMGIHAVNARELRIASSCDLVLLRKGKSLAPRCRVLHQVLKAMLLVAAPPRTHIWTDSKAKREGLLLATRVEAVKAAERAILAAKRQDDPELVESVCIHAWNLSLPLLQPHLRGQLSRVFNLSIGALEEMDSLLLELRARLLLENSKLEVSSEFLSKAYASVSKALALDYSVSAMQAKTLDELRKQESKMTTRPVDIHLMHLKKKLAWKLDMEESVDDGGAPEDRVHALVEQARESKDSAAVRTTLTRASELLVALVEQKTPPERLVVTWLGVCKVLKDKLGDCSTAEQFATRGLETFFSVGLSSSPATTEAVAYELSPESSMRTEKSLVVLELDFRSLLVEILAARLKSRSKQIEAAKRQLESVHHHHSRRAPTRQQHIDDVIELAALKLLPGESAMLGVQQQHRLLEIASHDRTNAEAIEARANGIENELEEMKRELLGHLAASLAVAGRLGWQFTLENTCVYLWNYHFHLFRMLAAPTAYTALDAFPGADGELLAAVHLMRFAELKTRAQLAQNVKEVTLGDSAPAFLKAAAYLEALESSTAQQQAVSAAGQSYFQKAVTLWQSVASEMVAPLMSGAPDTATSLTMEEVQHQLEIFTELWARVSHGALRLQQHRFVIEAVLALGAGESTPRKLVLAALQHLARAVEYGDHAKTASLVAKASEVVWNAALMVLTSIQRSGSNEYDTADVKLVIEILRKVVVLLGRVCEAASEWSEASGICEDALASKVAASIPARSLNEIRTAAAISAAKLGKSFVGGGAAGAGAGAGGREKRKAEEQNPILKAKILKKIAFSSANDPLTQLKTLASAHAELEGRPEEQAKLIRVFVMRAMVAASFLERWEFVENALHCVQRAWEGVISLVNTADLKQRFATVTRASELDFDAWKCFEKPRHSVPESSEEWVAFYLQFAKELAAETSSAAISECEMTFYAYDANSKRNIVENPPYQLSLLFLEQQSAAFKRMSVAAPPETILASLPPHCRILSLQLSPDKCFLYCALVGSSEKQYALARMECTVLFVSMDSLAALGLSSANDKLEREFSAIIVDTTELFAPLFGHSTLQAVLQSEIPGVALTLLLDRDLEFLPVEALPTFEKADSIARDFSLHVLFQRLQAQKTQPFKRDDMRFIVDPYQEDPGLDSQTMESVLQQHVKRPGAAFSNWTEAVEHGQAPTPIDWQHALLNRRGGGLFFLGANRVLGSSVSPSDLLAMSPALNCHFVCLLDRAENTASARRQSKVDSDKPECQLVIERDAYANAMLWSLAGVNVLVLNQWATTFNGNRRLANGLLSKLAKGFSVGKGLKKYGELVTPSGIVFTAPPSNASSAVASASSLPPASSSTSSTVLLSPADASAAAISAAASIASKFHQTNAKPTSSDAGTKSGGKQRLKSRIRFNTVVYGLAHLVLKSSDAT